VKVAVVGSRDYPNLEQVRAFVASLPEGTEVFTGGARGVDRAAELTARAHHLRVVVVVAQWHVYGKKAGYIRNAELVAQVDKVVAFWYAGSKGTAHVIRCAETSQKLITVFNA